MTFSMCLRAANQAYAMALAALPNAEVEIGEKRPAPRTTDALCVSSYKSTAWTTLAEDTRDARRRIIEKFRLRHAAVIVRLSPVSRVRFRRNSCSRALIVARRSLFTDPNHVKASDSGRVEGGVVSTYSDAFDEDHIAVEDLKARYIGGGLGDGIVKKRLEEVLQALLAPIRDRRRHSRDPGYVLQVVNRGTARAREITDATLREVRTALGLFILN